jgi:hypothetical protein
MGDAIAASRALFLEAFWWFLYRSSGFAVSVPAASMTLLLNAIQLHQPWISVHQCPPSMVILFCLLLFCFLNVKKRILSMGCLFVVLMLKYIFYMKIPLHF